MARRRAPASLPRTASVPAPVGGWNARDPLAFMKPTDAVALDNWYVDQTGELRTRGGSSRHASGFTAHVETLISYQPPGDLPKLFAVAGGSIYDASNGGTIPAASVTGLSTSRVEYATMTVLGGSYLVLGNGVDVPRLYTNGTWSNYSATNAVLNTLNSPAIMANRLWWLQTGTLNAWYGEITSIGGSLTRFAMGSLFSLGGTLVAQASWTRDGGEGPEDYTCFISSMGEVLIYSGTDPSSASTWTKVGLFKIAPPIGRRCTMKAGADLAILTTQGVVLLGQVLDSNVSGQSTIAVTNKILGAFSAASQAGSTMFGWQLMEVVNQGLVVTNVPVDGGFHQYVLTVAKGTWARFKGLNGVCWAYHNGKLYFGTKLNSANKAFVMSHSPDIESDDNGTTTGKIECYLQTAFSEFGNPRNKQFLQVRPLMRAPEGFMPRLVLKLDYDTTIPIAQTVTAANTNGIPSWSGWEWLGQNWSFIRAPTSGWASVSGIGRSASFAFSISTDVTLSMDGIDLTYQAGGLL